MTHQNNAGVEQARDDESVTNPGREGRCVLGAHETPCLCSDQVQRPSYRAASAAASARRAGEAVALVEGNLTRHEPVEATQVSDTPLICGHAEHLIEVTFVKSTVPRDVDLVETH